MALIGMSRKEGRKMSRYRILSLILGITGCLAVMICILTDWSDSTFLPLALVLTGAANLVNLVAIRQEKRAELQK